MCPRSQHFPFYFFQNSEQILLLPPKISFSSKYFMEEKQTKSTLPWLGVQTHGDFHTAQTWGLETLWLLGKASFPKLLKEMMLDDFLVTKFCSLDFFHHFSADTEQY